MNNVIRGSGLNAGTFESGDSVSPAEVRLVVYRCADGHITRARFFAGADEIRVQWDCATCRQPAFTDISDAVPLPPPTRLPAQHKSHWQHLLERRSIEDLETLLQERLALLRTRNPEIAGDLTLVPGGSSESPNGADLADDVKSLDGMDGVPA